MKSSVATEATLSYKQKEIFYIHFPTDRTAHAFDGSIVDHWLKQEIVQTTNASTMQPRLDDPNLYRQMLYHLSYVPPPLGG